ncbi:MAG: DUF2341 domain-containing protein [Myxococcales bacterium FL481]|nr:MAG: DUF2341 domain-containing protein [Myxococcales bacterium FL481]
MGSCSWLDAFECSQDSECIVADEYGVCEPVGYCSFTDESCSSGRRFGDHAGGSLGGVCVPGWGDGVEDDGEPDSAAQSSSGEGEGSSVGDATSDGLTSEGADDNDMHESATGEEEDGADESATSDATTDDDATDEDGEEEAGWSWSRPVTVTAQRHFEGRPILVELRDGDNFDFSELSAGGVDLRWSTDPSLVSGFDLPHWIEHWGADSARVWVRLPNLVAQTPTTVYMFFGNDSAIDASDRPGTFPRSLVVTDVAELSGEQAFDWIEVAAGGKLRVGGSGRLVLDAAWVAVHGSIDGDGRGYPSAQGPGAGGSSTTAGGGGGGHGGAGGRGGFDAGDSPGAGGDSDNSVPTQATPGSGGGATDMRAGGAGGAGLAIEATALVLAGVIDVDGEAGKSVDKNKERSGGGGAGGAIVLRAREIVLEGSLRARGGDGGNLGGTYVGADGGGGGGGGHVQVRYDRVLHESETAEVDVSGGRPGAYGSKGLPQGGEDGTMQLLGNYVDPIRVEVGSKRSIGDSPLISVEFAAGEAL